MHAKSMRYCQTTKCSKRRSTPLASPRWALARVHLALQSVGAVYATWHAAGVGVLRHHMSAPFHYCGVCVTLRHTRLGACQPQELAVTRLSQASSSDLMEFAQWLYKSYRGEILECHISGAGSRRSRYMRASVVAAYSISSAAGPSTTAKGHAQHACPTRRFLDSCCLHNCCRCGWAGGLQPGGAAADVAEGRHQQHPLSGMPQQHLLRVWALRP